MMVDNDLFAWRSLFTRQNLTLHQKLICSTMITLALLSYFAFSGLAHGGEPTLNYRVVAVYPHDPLAFTQGLFVYGGSLYESTGLYGASSLRQVDLEAGSVARKINLPPTYFGEGITRLNNQIVLLTWREGQGFIYDLETFTQVGDFALFTEGWGITFDGEKLIMSDGSDQLIFLDPVTFEPVDKVAVTSSRGKVKNLNELEYINGIVFANIWQSANIALIDPAEGKVCGWLDLSGLPEIAKRNDYPGIDVPNGIAHLEDKNHILVTGKLWPHIYELEIEELTSVCQ